jgi:hypothetical protein
MDEPSSRIVCWETHDQPASGREKCGVSSRRIVEFEACLSAVPDTSALTDDIEV